jgi:hypothetical protein
MYPEEYETANHQRKQAAFYTAPQQNNSNNE